MDKEHPDQKNKAHQRQVVAFIFVVLFLFVGMAIVLSNFSRPYLKSDFFNFWLASHMVLTGQDPYSEVQWLAGHELYAVNWMPDATFLYPLPLALLLSPLGVFTPKIAYLLWVVITNIFVTLSVLLIAKTWMKWNGTLAFAISVSAFLFRPYLIAVASGQLVGLFLFVTSLAVYFWQQKKWFLGGILIGLLNLKPSYGALFLILIGIWFTRIRQYRAIAGIIVANLILYLTGFLQNSKWLQLFFAIGQKKFTETIGMPPTIWSMGSLVCKADNICTGWVGGGIVVVLLILFILVININHVGSPSTTMVVSLAIPLSLLFVPYNWAYDQILLIVSVTFITGLLQHSRRIKYLHWLFPFLIDVFAIMLMLWAHVQGVDMWSLLLPTLIAAIIFFFLFTNGENISVENKVLTAINDDKQA